MLGRFETPAPRPLPADAETCLAIRRAERQRLAQRLHDTVCQSLTGTHLQAMVIARTLRKNGAEAAGDVARLVDLLDEVVREMHAFTRQLTAEEAEPSDPDESR